MEVRVFPNFARPGVGLKPKREPTRPLLPQHARHCPVLEAGSGAGFLVYAPVEPRESYYVEYEGKGRYKFVYYLQAQGGRTSPIFAVSITLPPGGAGPVREEVAFLGAAAIPREDAAKVARVFLVFEDLGAPPGAVPLRGATNFLTPAGWDTTYTPIFNMIERPMLPMVAVRVETDRGAHETSFRYVLQPGEGISVSHSVPIGQVFFVPREDAVMRECTPEEVAAIRQSQSAFARHKSEAAQRTPYGLTFSPHYLRQSRAQRP